MSIKTPNVADTYSRFFVDMFDEKSMIGVPAGFAAFWGKDKDQTIIDPGALAFDIDIVRGNEKLAPLILRGDDSMSIGKTRKDLNQELRTVNSRVVPLIEETTPIGATQINQRVSGENPYSNLTPMDRMRILAGKAHKEQFRRILRTYSFLCAQSVLTGKMPAVINTSNTALIYDFQRSSNMEKTLVGGEKWDDASVDPTDSISEGAKLIRVNGKEKPDMIVFGGDAMEAFLQNENIKVDGNNRRIKTVEAGMVDVPPPRFQRFVDAGFEYWGYLKTKDQGYQLHMFTLPEVYEDEAGNSQDYMPSDQALVCYSNGRNDRYFGAFERIPQPQIEMQMYQQMFGFSPLLPPMPEIAAPAGLYRPEMFYCDAFCSDNKKTVKLRTQSAPIFATTQTDVFYTIKEVV